MRVVAVIATADREVLLYFEDGGVIEVVNPPPHFDAIEGMEVQVDPEYLLVRGKVIARFVDACKVEMTKTKKLNSP